MTNREAENKKNRLKGGFIIYVSGGTAFSRGGAENWRRSLGGAKKTVVDF